jgi:hypothetical protein
MRAALYQISSFEKVRWTSPFTVEKKAKIEAKNAQNQAAKCSETRSEKRRRKGKKRKTKI